MVSELIQQARILDPLSQTDRVADVLIVDGHIAAIAPEEVPEEAIITPAEGCILGPGLVDLYSHSGEPGFEPRETLMSLAKGAIAGGFTRLHLLPDTQPPLDTASAVAGLRSHLVQHLGHLPIQIEPWGALTQGLAGEQMAELGDLLAAQVMGFAEGRPLSHPGLVQRILEYLHPHPCPIALWCCDRQLARRGVVRDGVEALRLGLTGIPDAAETAPLAGLLECVAETGTPVHLMRVSTARSVALIRAAKERGLPITASTPWMHLLLTVQHTATYDPHLRLDPPLGNPTDHQALIQAVAEGVIDAIAIDHTPYTYEEKTVAFAEAPPGAIGLELALPLLWEQVTSGQWDALTLWSRLSMDPARCLNQTPGAIAPGELAELVLFDPRPGWQVEASTLQSQSCNTPWLGRSLQGKVVKTWFGERTWTGPLLRND
jgi:dihydroorotase